MPFLLLMPSYNQAHYIGDAVRSVLNQDDPDWELWILDNSTDNTAEVMRQFDDPRIRFHHIPERMDPGSCLNWMLQRARGEHFSYVHTDNNLEPGYVRQLRSALQGKELALAYCDMHVIDGAGKRERLFRRGEFDLGRLVSFDTLGVPFAATTKLAASIGGFSAEDPADDVSFCISAYGRAELIYVAEPLIEYRLHEGSRTEAVGGAPGMQKVFLACLAKAVRSLEQRGHDPVGQAARRLEKLLSEFDDIARTLWNERLGHLPAWWIGPFGVDLLFQQGVFKLTNMEPGHHAPPPPLLCWTADGRWIDPIRYALVRRRVGRANDLRYFSFRMLPTLLPWAHLALGASSGEPVRFRIRSLDFRTVWIARLLQAELNWTPCIDPGIGTPRWLKWARATGNEPLLSCAHGVHLGHEQLTVSAP